MDTTENVESDLVYQVVGCAMAVLNELGHGLREKTYERALCVELNIQGIRFSAQEKHPVIYKGHHIDEYVPDLEIPGRLIIEAKTVDRIIDDHLGQALNYLKVTGIETAVILNFAHATLEWKKVVLTRNHLRE